jgi:predicted esterase
VNIKWKNDSPKSLNFNFRNHKIKTKFIGMIGSDTISGYIKSSKKNAIRLGISPRLSIFMVKEKPCLPASPLPSLHASMPPCSPASLSPRYHTAIFPNVGINEEISYGAAKGYYSSMAVEGEGYDYQQIILDAMEKMYVNPTKEAIVHLLNRNPVSFALTDLQALRMDIYQPAADNQMKRPLILLFHGGAFILGDKATESIQALAYNFASKGYVVASVNYRMGFNLASKSSLERAAYRAVQDARAALRYLSANATTYRIDPEWVFLGGSSAGAITALNVAFMKEEERPESSRRNLFRAQPDLGGLDESTNQLSGSFKIRAVANLWGAVSDTNLIDNNERIPILSIHGDADKIVPYNYAYPFLDLDTSITSNIVTKLYGSYPIHRRLQSLNMPGELITLPNAGHEPQYELGMYQLVMDTVITRATDFYFKAMFNFPEINGPRQIAMGMKPPVYSIPVQDEISYYWSVSGGKIVPGSAQNSAKVVWLAERSGNVSLVMVHENGANVEVQVAVVLPD